MLGMLLADIAADIATAYYFNFSLLEISWQFLKMFKRKERKKMKETRKDEIKYKKGEEND